MFIQSKTWDQMFQQKLMERTALEVKNINILADDFSKSLLKLIDSTDKVDPVVLNSLTKDTFFSIASYLTEFQQENELILRDFKERIRVKK